MKKNLIVALCIFSIHFLFCDSRIYIEKTGDKIVKNQIEIENMSNGYKILFNSTNGDVIEMTADIDYSTLIFNYENKIKSITLTAKLLNGKLFINGEYKNKIISVQYNKKI